MPHNVAYRDGTTVRAVDLTTNIISRYAGGAPPAGLGSIIDNVLALDAAIFHVTSLAVDADGNLFLAEPENCIIRRVDYATKMITTIAGHWIEDEPGDLAFNQLTSCGYTGNNGPAVDAKLSMNVFIEFDANGDLVFSQSLARPQGLSPGGVIRKLTKSSTDGRITGRPDEIITTIFGNGVDSTTVPGADRRKRIFGRSVCVWQS